MSYLFRKMFYSDGIDFDVYFVHRPKQKMKNLQISQVILFVMISAFLAGCELVGDIFEAGVWLGVIIVVAVIILIFWLIRKFMG